MIRFAIPIRTANPLNSRRHWRSVYAQGKRDKAATRLVLSQHRPPPLPVVVTMTRVSPGVGFDRHDALPASCKHLVDAVAEWLGVDDADESVTWLYSQRRGAPKQYAVDVVIEARVSE